MADFVQNSQTKNAVRTLASRIADVAAFKLIVQSVITDNPFACVEYMTAGENHAPVEKTREGYTARIVYEDGNAQRYRPRITRYPVHSVYRPLILCVDATGFSHHRVCAG